MVLAHTIVGVAAGEYFGKFWFVFLGSVIPDIDHIYILLRYKIYTPKKIIDAIRFEKKYNLVFKTPFVHSILGAVVFSLPIAFFDVTGAGYFFLAYIGHLILDWPDYDEKRYFFPLKTRFRGFWLIGSRQELFFTLCLLAFLFFR